MAEFINDHLDNLIMYLPIHIKLYFMNYGYMSFVQDMF